MKQTEAEMQGETGGRDQAAEPLVSVDAGTLTQEQLDELKQRAGKADEHWERLLRTTADFDNYKKSRTLFALQMRTFWKS
jgi:molecular chaperone GrpE (heat shock protein)